MCKGNIHKCPKCPKMTENPPCKKMFWILSKKLKIHGHAGADSLDTRTVSDICFRCNSKRVDALLGCILVGWTLVPPSFNDGHSLLIIAGKGSNSEMEEQSWRPFIHSDFPITWRYVGKAWLLNVAVAFGLVQYEMHRKTDFKTTKKGFIHSLSCRMNKTL